MSGPLKNARRERFAQAIVAGHVQTAAYKLAGYESANPKSIDEIASRLRAKPEVSARIAELLADSAEEAGITAERIMRELAKIGFSDIRKMFGPGGALKRIEDLDDDTAGALSSIEVVTKRVPGGDQAEVEHVAKVRLWDKRAALVDLGKATGLFKDGGDAPQSVTVYVERTGRSDHG